MADTGKTIALIQALTGGPIDELKSAVEQISQTGIDASDASSGQVPVADGEGSWDWGSAGVSDVQVDDNSILVNGVAKIKVGAGLRVGNNSDRAIMLNAPNQGNIRTRSEAYALTPKVQDMAVFYGLAWAAGDETQAGETTLGTYTETAKSKISDMLNAPESVSGSTPSIPAKAGVSYVCGECSTLTITVPNTGCFDVLFDSGSTPTVLTVTPPTGMTVEWLGNFDPTALSANATYEINILVKPDINKCLGVACAWT